MKPRPKAVWHIGTCLQCRAEGDVLTIAANPLDLSLYGECLANVVGSAGGVRLGILKRWLLVIKL